MKENRIATLDQTCISSIGQAWLLQVKVHSFKGDSRPAQVGKSWLDPPIPAALAGPQKSVLETLLGQTGSVAMLRSLFQPKLHLGTLQDQFTT